MKAAHLPEILPKRLAHLALIFINAFFRCCKRTRHEQLMEAVEDQEHHLAAVYSDVSTFTTVSPL